MKTWDVYLAFNITNTPPSRKWLTRNGLKFNDGKFAVPDDWTLQPLPGSGDWLLLVPGKPAMRLIVLDDVKPTKKRVRPEK